MISPITVEMLRADWDDNPSLDPDELAMLRTLPEPMLQLALDRSFEQYREMYFHVLDNTRSDATHKLLSWLAVRAS